MTLEAGMTVTRFLEAQPACRVGDLDRALAFYGKLGFVAGHRSGDVHQVLRSGEVTIHLSTIEGGPGTFQIMVVGIDDLFRTTVSSGVEILFDGMAQREWGCRDFTIRDPDGNSITFSEQLRDA